MKYYAIVHCEKVAYANTPVNFVWDKSNRWVFNMVAIPKPLSYRTAKKKVSEEMDKDNTITKTLVISVEEYEKHGISW